MAASTGKTKELEPQSSDIGVCVLPERTVKRDILSTDQKALSINLDRKIYGTFAEIGAGQEVVRHFFHVGGASGTVAKSMSAYDMTFSDAIYGIEESGRYVCENRLTKMLDKEYTLLTKRLEEKRAKSTSFFVFADTVAARSFVKKNSECHAWLGVRYQTHPEGPANSIHVHVRLLDADNIHQQEVVGDLGVNLIYGAIYLYKDPKTFIASLFDNIAEGRMECNRVKFIGPDFGHIDNRLMNLELLKQRMTHAILFTPNGDIAEPSEILYKRPVLIQRGSFRPPTLVSMDMHEKALALFEKEEAVIPDKDRIVNLKEITIQNLSSEGGIDAADFLSRVDVMAGLGFNVLVSNYFEYYLLSSYLSRYTNKMVGMVMGIPELSQLFDEKYYSYLEGGLMEAFGKLLSRLVKIYLYPTQDKASGQLLTAKTFKPQAHLEPLFQYIVNSGRLENIGNYNREALSVFSKDVLAKIQQKGNKDWESQVPAAAAAIIKSKKIFGYTG